ncbi:MULTISPECIES: dTDP-4-amino-4,6-dideoxyglucose formyltransferase [Croceibacter]|uniref:dTDP-4-amino-4,6-dideoxyglucose formyltransferase n=1 Tax=Croceibacter TaxID=216431 RepID=UPI000C63F53F|nr:MULTISPECIES: dTDP-4-amino-4,6-dideoxyglucose formyltransferase [Croceibacter]MBG24874.1 hypothetical protein [Croceibacter sp.]|tara:strand:+ start:1507 stop:2244 length:738 start_codon:yes stop_codon:yes gene_type:complete
MFKKILIITDNLDISKKLKKIIRAKNIEDLFYYSVSPFSKKNEFSNALDCTVSSFDMRMEGDVLEIINSYDLVLSIHCKQIFPEKLLKSVRCINIHPGYNPINRGWYPQVFSIIQNLPVGATIHEIDTEIDHGNIIAREFVEKKNTDTSLTLYLRIVEKELQLFDKNIIDIINDNYKTSVPECEGNLFLKKDFNKLKEIDLNEKSTAWTLINKLRALTHGNYNNAYFINPETGKKIYVSISLKEV